MNEGVKGRPQHPPAAGTQRRSRRRSWRVFMAAFAALIVIQSITITFPIRARVVNERTGEPLPQTEVVAVWKLHRATPAGAVLGPLLKVERARTNDSGELRIGPAFLTHVPLLPFTWFVRSYFGMPVLYIAKDGFYAQGVVDGSVAEAGSRGPSFLFLRTSSIDATNISVKPGGVAAQEYSNYRRDHNLVRAEIGEALGMCAASWFCQLTE